MHAMPVDPGGVGVQRKLGGRNCDEVPFSKRVTSVQFNGPVEYLRSNFIGGIKRLPVRVVLK